LQKIYLGEDELLVLTKGEAPTRRISKRKKGKLQNDLLQGKTVALPKSLPRFSYGMNIRKPRNIGKTFNPVDGES